MYRYMKAGLFALAFTAMAAPAFAQQSTTLEVKKSDRYGTYLTDSQGRTLYVFMADKPNAGSTCYGACAEAWPPLLVQGELKAGPGVDASLLGTVTRKDGSRQVTYDGWPLYQFIKDQKPGQTSGEASRGFGAPWHMLAPDGHHIEGPR